VAKIGTACEARRGTATEAQRHGDLVAIGGDTLTVADLDYNWFLRALTQKLAGRPAAALDDRRNVVLTAPTGELRRWLTRAPAGAFGAPMTFTRKR
jgi:hypothetical protein